MNIYHARIPDIFGYGLEAFALTSGGAMKALRKEHQRWKKMFDGEYSFPKAFDYFGGHLRRLSDEEAGAEHDVGKGIEVEFGKKGNTIIKEKA